MCHAGTEFSREARLDEAAAAEGLLRSWLCCRPARHRQDEMTKYTGQDVQCACSKAEVL
jgi:hypothetical protein